MDVVQVSSLVVWNLNPTVRWVGGQKLDEVLLVSEALGLHP